MLQFPLPPVLARLLVAGEEHGCSTEMAAIAALLQGENIALNTGLGVRYDMGILVLRVDFGLGLHAPYDTGRTGYFNLNPLKDGFAWHFAIGYPF